MASYKFPIKIQKLNEDTEEWQDYYLSKEAEKNNNPVIHANINKVVGKEYTQASTNISHSTFNFKVRYCEKLKDVIYNTEAFRVVYDNRIFDIKNVDHFEENKTELTITGEYNGQSN